MLSPRSLRTPHVAYHHLPKDWVVFVSHRWWNPENAFPDNDEGEKVGVLMGSVIFCLHKSTHVVLRAPSIVCSRSIPSSSPCHPHQYDIVCGAVNEMIKERSVCSD